MSGLKEIIMRIHQNLMYKQFGRALLLVFLLLFIFSGAFAQVAKDNFEVKLVAFKVKNKVYLRWFLGNSTQWHSANKQGFIIERAEGITGDYIKLNIPSEESFS